MEKTVQTKKIRKRGVIASLLTASLLLSNVLPYANAHAADTSNNDIIVTPINLQSEDVIEGQYVIVFKKGVSVEEMKAEIKKYSGNVVKEYFDLNMATVSLTKSKYNQFIQETEIVTVVEPNLEFEQVGRTTQYAHDLVNVESAWNSQYTGKGINIAVVDSGIAKNHTDINVVGGISMVDYTSSYDDDAGHGTHVAGVIGSLKNNSGTVGIAYDANLYAVKVLNKFGRGELSDIIAGVRWAIEQNFDIINISIGTDQYSRVFHDLIKEAKAKGILVVASTGNDNTSVKYPAKFPETIAVGAVDQNKNKADFSNFGPEIDLVAPGVNIASTYTSGHAIGQGTSMAAPHVSALLALYKNAYPHLSSSEIEQMLFTNAEDLGASGFDDYYGHGLARFPQLTPPVEEETPPTEPVVPPVTEETPPTETAPPVEEETPPTETQPPVVEENIITLDTGVSLNQATRELEWEIPNAVRYQLAVQKVSNSVEDLGQKTLASSNYDLNRFKLEDDNEYALTITPRIGSGYSKDEAITLGLTTANGQYSIHKIESPVEENEDPTETAPIINPIVTLSNGVAINTDTSELTWPVIDGSRRYQINLSTTNEKEKTTLVGEPTYVLSRMRLTENVEYVVSLIPRFDTYDESRALKAKVVYQNGKYNIIEYVEPVIENPTFEEPPVSETPVVEERPVIEMPVNEEQPMNENILPPFELPTGLGNDLALLGFEITASKQLRFPSITDSKRYLVEVAEQGFSGLSLQSKYNRNVTATQFSLSALPKNKIYQLTIVPYINKTYDYEKAYTVQVDTSDYTLH